MTQPGQGDQGAGGNEQPKPPPKPKQTSAPALTRGALVSFRWADPLLGTKLDGVGVVARVSDEDGATVAVFPLAQNHVEVDPADIEPAELGSGDEG